MKIHEFPAVPFQSSMIARPKEIVTQMNDRYVKMHPLIRHVLLAVTEETKETTPPCTRSSGEMLSSVGRVCIQTDEFVMF